MLPKRTEFFALLAAHSERVLAGANAMHRLVNSLGVSEQDVAALAEEINMNESSAEKIKNDVLTMLHKSMVTPLNRDQVYALTMDIDAVMDRVQDVAQAVRTYNITESSTESHELASMTVDACMRLTRAIASLKERERSEETVNLCVAIEHIEEKSVAVIYRAIHSLFKAEGNEEAALRAMRMRQFYALQERVLRASKKSAQTVEEILLQNA